MLEQIYSSIRTYPKYSCLGGKTSNFKLFCHLLVAMLDSEISEVDVQDLGKVPVETTYNEFVTDYVEDHELPEPGTDIARTEFAKDFANSLEDKMEDLESTSEEVRHYAASVGAREARETSQGARDVEVLNEYGAIQAVLDDRGLLGTVASTASPTGHGFMNPHRKKENVSINEMVEAATSGFTSYRDEQVKRGI